MSIIKIGDRWLPLLNSTVTSFNRKKRRFLLDLLRSGYKGAFAFLCAYVPRSRPLFFVLRAYLVFHVFCIEPVIDTPLPDDWTGFSAAFVEALKGTVRS